MPCPHRPLPPPPPSRFAKCGDKRLPQPSGVFADDVFSEKDTRFLYCAMSACSLLGILDRLGRERTVTYYR